MSQIQQVFQFNLVVGMLQICKLERIQVFACAFSSHGSQTH